MEKINAKFTFLVGEEYTRLEVYDEASGVTFLSAKFTPGQLSAMLSRLSMVEAEEATVTGLDVVGKIREQRNVSVPMLDQSYNKDETKSIVERSVDAYMKDTKLGEDGWVCSMYIGSQNSFTMKGDDYTFRTYIVRWVDNPKRRRRRSKL